MRNNADLQIVIDESEPSIRELLDCSVEELIPLLRDTGSDIYLPVNRILRPEPRARQQLSDLKPVASASWRDLRVVQLENGSIVVERGGDVLPQSKPALREIARDVGVDIMNAVGNPKNTRSLGSDIIKALS